MDQQGTTASPANGATTAHDLFALTDEQILEFEPEVNVAPGFSPASSPTRASSSSAPAAVIPSEARDPGNTFESSESASSRHDQGPRSTGHEAQPGVALSQEPPPWLATQMRDPWSGEEARELWNGVLQTRSEAAAYRAAFATPEDARALKELYPGGVNEARESATRARLLEDIDRAYFGAPGGSAEQTGAARANLAQSMLREDPAAFREMVFAGLRALEQAQKGSTGSENTSNLPRLAKAFGAPGAGANAVPPFRAPTSITEGQPTSNDDGPKPGATAMTSESPTSVVGGAQHAAPQPGTVTGNDAHVAAYTAFEKAANEDLERSVGAAITHTIQQALPNLGKDEGKATAGARQGVPLRERLSAAVRQDVEAALKGDRQLSEQIAQILSARRFDNETRAQVVRLIDDRARQLVPSAARRVINDWTQTTLATHRGNASRGDAASSRTEIEPVATHGSVTRGESTSPAAFSQAAQTRPGADPHRNASRSDARRLDYRKLSDEQILDL